MASPSDQQSDQAGPGGEPAAAAVILAPSASHQTRATWKRRWQQWLEIFNLRKCVVGPVFERDMRVLGRRGSTYLWRCVLGATVSFFFIVAMFGTASDFSGGSVIRQIQSQQGLASTLSTVIMWVLAIGAPLIALVLTANLVSQERFAATLEGVATSPLRPLHVIVSGVAARLSQVLIMLAMPVPVLLASRMFGSLELSTIVQSYVVVVFMTVAAACVGAYASVKHVRLPQAISMGIGALVLIQIWPLIVLLMETLWDWAQSTAAGGGGRMGGGMPRSLGLLAFAPLTGLVLQSGETLFGGAVWGGKLTIVMLGAAVNTLVSVVSIALASRGLAGLIRRGELSATVTQRPGMLQRLFNAVFGGRGEVRKMLKEGAGSAEAPVTIAERQSRVVGENPVRWREARLLDKHRMKRWVAGILMPLLFAGMLVVSLVSPGMMGFESIAVTMTVLATLVLMLRTVTSMSDAISSERQTGTWIALITTPMEASRIIHGKLVGPMVRHWPLVAVVVTPSVIAVLLGRGAVLLPLMILLIVTMWGIMAQVTGLFFSLVMKKAGAATTLNLGFYLVLWLGVPIALAVLQSVLRIGGERGVVEAVLLTNPVYMVGQTMEQGVWQSSQWGSGGSQFRLLGEQISSPAYAMALMGLWLLVVGAAWGLVRLMIARFATLSLRGT